MYLSSLLIGFREIEPRKQKYKKLLKELFSIEYNDVNKLEYKNTIKE